METKKNIAVDTFIYLVTIGSVYTLLCFIVVLLTQTQFWLFWPGYGIGIYSLVSPIMLIVYAGVYAAYKKYLRARFSKWMLYFNFLYLFFLLGSLIYSLIFYKEL
ncbi:MAG: hypothetical protein JST55_13990 [Bacteroidetes bacterium]|nr:hypothetical protein [Bacteroidota bacterium]